VANEISDYMYRKRRVSRMRPSKRELPKDENRSRITIRHLGVFDEVFNDLDPYRMLAEKAPRVENFRAKYLRGRACATYGQGNRVSV